MKLFTEEQRAKLLANGARRGADHKPVVKWFNPCGAGTGDVPISVEIRGAGVAG